jgi:DNA-nicking Smr family endonuclease
MVKTCDTASIQPVETSLPISEKEIAQQSLSKQSLSQPLPSKPLKTKQPTQEIDKRTLKELKTGKRRPEAVLDLHGMTVNQAHETIRSFIHSSHTLYGRRCVLIITGKGSDKSNLPFDMPVRGVLRREVPVWLQSAEFRDYVSGVSVAHPRDGGQGALYVYLRKKN